MRYQSWCARRARSLRACLEDRYGEFVVPKAPCVVELDIELVEPEIETEPRGGMGSSEPGIEELGYGEEEDAEDLSVRLESGRWIMERGRLPRGMGSRNAAGAGCARPRILTPSMACCAFCTRSSWPAQGGFLVHAASAVRNGRAFVFAGVSGHGKTTLARLAPPDVTLLTDEISYVGREECRCQESGVSGVRSREPGVRS